MNSNEILRMVIKLVGLAVFISGVIQASSSLPMVYEQMKNMDVGAPAASFIGAFASPIIIGLLLWFFPAPVANTIIKEELNVAPQNEFLRGIENIGIRILGLYLLYHGISDLVYNYISYRQEAEMLRENINIFGKGSTKAAFIVTGIEIIISIILIIGANVISTMIRKIKFAS